ncbi:glycosyltransferase family protein [Mesobacillus subterraneus]|uniref:glycosyltransferase family protein n=1 Tax=Mesobacillus subterraneus TaxID=285983 RepID=UPI00203C4E87|nr:glycosyltransferase family protein [Mesobacillus subterraneus]MCM3663651.1 glycosyltransferase family protein [Mesobacillus subterraneus]MCM3683416.1 glycosyltransferase family protein [Mesobacillus subterraneus]
MKVAAIIQARMGSTRLPGKILKTVNGKTLLEYQIERVERAKLIDEIIIATTIKESDDPIVQLCQQLSIPYYRGSEDDVLSRYYEAAINNNVQVIVRLTSDCPIIDPEIIDETIRVYLDNKNTVDYVSNTLERTFPRGLDTEVFSFDVLNQAYKTSKEKIYREHVTSFIYGNPDTFKLKNVPSLNDYSEHRWTVDTEEDFILIKNILEALYPVEKEFKLNDIIKLLNENPEWKEINSHIEQKKLIE